jgi:tRNA (guanosine-2'-O-)-methyltransferase
MVMNNDTPTIKFLSDFVSEKRLDRIEKILAQRTRYLTIVLEDIYQSQNASAVLRTCECFGVQDVHVIENRNQYNINPMVVQGADKWLTVHRYSKAENNSIEVLNSLKNEGYRIVVTSLDEGSIELNDFEIKHGKFAIVFGNEHNGVSGCMMENADERLKISMCGFTQSLNISVSAGIIISNLTRMIKSSITEWQLSDLEKDGLRAEWLMKSVKNPQLLLNHLAEECQE